MDDQTPQIIWQKNGTPVSQRFDDPYFSFENGLAETRHVFLDGNDLPARFSDGFHVAELGFGTGLNFLATVLAWQASGVQGHLQYTSFEAFPMPRETVVTALSAFPELAELTRHLSDIYTPGAFKHRFGTQITLEIIAGDARQMLPAWAGQADAWYLDGFSPAKNPELWGNDLLEAVAGHTARRGSFATYTAAGHIRRALAQAGFEVTRIPGFGRKRHMSVGRLG